RFPALVLLGCNIRIATERTAARRCRGREAEALIEGRNLEARPVACCQSRVGCGMIIGWRNGEARLIAEIFRHVIADAACEEDTVPKIQMLRRIDGERIFPD